MNIKAAPPLSPARDQETPLSRHICVSRFGHTCILPHNQLLKSPLNQFHQIIRCAFMSQHAAVDTDIVTL